MISLGYYLPVIAAMWMGDGREQEPTPAQDTPAAPPPDAAEEGALPALAGGSPELDEPAGSGASAAPGPTDQGPRAQTMPGRQPEVALVALLAGAATLFFGIFPGPLFDLVRGTGSALGLF